MNMASTISLLIINLLFTITFAHLINNNIESERERITAKMASYMDESADPCENFYQYACGNYVKHNQKQRNDAYQSVLDTMQSDNNEILAELLMEPIDEVEDVHSVKQAKIFYQSCIRQDDVFDVKYRSEYFNFVNREFNVYWIYYDWATAMAKAKGYFGIDLFLEESYSTYFDVRFDLYNFDIGYSENDQAVKKIIIKKLLQAYDYTNSRIKQVLEDIERLQHEVKIGGGRRSSNFPSSPFSTLISNFLSVSELSRYRINQNGFIEYLNMDPRQPGMITPHNMNRFLAMTDSMHYNAKTVWEYVKIRILIALHLNEFKLPRNHAVFCVEAAKDAIRPIVNSMYFNSKHYDNQIENEVEVMISYIRSSYTDNIDNTDWLDKKTKKKIRKQLDTVKVTFGETSIYDDILTDIKYYSLNFTLDNFYENRVKSLKFHKSTRKYFTKQKELDSLEMNGRYKVDDNSIFIPGGILNLPLFSINLPKSYNYGSLGFVIAHEVGHGVDLVGREYNEDLSDALSTEYEQRTQCFIDQFSSYKEDYTNTPLDGKIALNDNIADSSGVKRAFDAYKYWYRDNQGSIDPKREILPGLNMTNYQLFFLSFAQTLCAEARGMLYHNLAYQNHATHKFRVIGSLSNFEEFSNIYSCSSESFLNPEEKCTYW